MNGNSSIAVGLLFVLRCLIPLGILFGISYLLRRWEFLNANSDEALLAGDDEDAVPVPAAVKAAGKETFKKSPPAAKKKTDGKKKSAASHRKEA
jgi:hypothetical protein